MKAQIARPDLKGNENNDSEAKEEGIFQDQEKPILLPLFAGCIFLIRP